MAASLNDILADPAKRESLERRFWPKVDVRGPKDCWPWTAKARHPFGYGCINSGRGNLYTSHRVAYALRNGGVPDDAYVLHSCDNPECCNPGHLSLGDHDQNMKDMKDRGRRIGRTHSEEARRKIAEGRAKNPPKISAEVRKQRSEAMKARWADPQQAARMICAGELNGNHGKRPPNHVIEAAKANHRSKRGYRHSEETKERMRQAALRRYAKR